MATEIQQRVNTAFVLLYEPAIASLLFGHTMIIQSGSGVCSTVNAKEVKFRFYLGFMI